MQHNRPPISEFFKLLIPDPAGKARTHQCSSDPGRGGVGFGGTGTQDMGAGAQPADQRPAAAELPAAQPAGAALHDLADAPGGRITAASVVRWPETRSFSGFARLTPSTRPRACQERGASFRPLAAGRADAGGDRRTFEGPSGQVLVNGSQGAAGSGGVRSKPSICAKSIPYDAN